MEKDLINLPRSQKKKIIKAAKKKNGFNKLSKDLILLLIKSQIIKIDVNKPETNYVVTDIGKNYIETIKDEKTDHKKENIQSWITLICSILAIIISICSLTLDIYHNVNDKKENSKEITEIINETTEIINTKGLEIE